MGVFYRGTRTGEFSALNFKSCHRTKHFKSSKTTQLVLLLVPTHHNTYIELPYYFMKDEIRHGTLTLTKFDTQHNFVADIFTKALPYPRFSYLIVDYSTSDLFIYLPLTRLQINVLQHTSLFLVGMMRVLICITSSYLSQYLPSKIGSVTWFFPDVLLRLEQFSIFSSFLFFFLFFPFFSSNTNFYSHRFTSIIVITTHIHRLTEYCAAGAYQS